MSMRRSMPIAKQGSKVQILVTGRLENGQLFEHTPPNQPLQFTLGKHEVVKGLEMAVEGMHVGQFKEVQIGAESGFGVRKDEYVQVIPRSSVSPDFKLEKGKIIAMQKQEGVAFQAVIKDFDDKTVTIDFNHPLAGQTLNFEIRLLDVE